VSGGRPQPTGLPAANHQSLCDHLLSVPLFCPSFLAKPTTTCPKSMTYHYHISTCQPTCRSLSEEDVTCQVNFVPVDGCTCPEGTFLDDSGKCVQATSCPCYHRGSTVPNGESVHDSGAIW
jgi:mucin-5B